MVVYPRAVCVFFQLVGLPRVTVPGILGATKTYIGEISDGSNQIKIFTIWTVTEGIAGIFGAIIGGYLCRPAGSMIPELRD